MELASKTEDVPTVDLGPVIADSKAQLEAPQKSGRGVKPGSKRGSYKKDRPSGDTPQAQTPQNAVGVPSVSAVVPLAHGFMAISTLPAMRAKIPELALAENEAMPLAHAVDELLKAYVPDLNAMSPKTAAWLGLGMVGGSLFISKMQVYYEKKEVPKARERDDRKSTPSPAREPGPQSDFPGVEVPTLGGPAIASEYFRKQ